MAVTSARPLQLKTAPTFPSLVVPPGTDVGAARKLLEQAEHGCLIANPLSAAARVVAAVRGHSGTSKVILVRRVSQRHGAHGTRWRVRERPIGFRHRSRRGCSMTRQTAAHARLPLPRGTRVSARRSFNAPAEEPAGSSDG